MNDLKHKLFGEKACFASLVGALVMLYTFAFISNPMVDTISNIGLNYRVMFFFLCLVLAYSTCINMLYFYNRVNFKHTWFNVLTYICTFAMVVASLTTTKVSNAQTVVHWTSAMMYISAVPVLMLWVECFRIYKRKEKKMIIPILVFHGINTVDIAYMLYSFIKFGPHEGKNGLMEIIPITVTILMLMVYNNTTWFTSEDKINKSVTAYSIDK